MNLTDLQRTELYLSEIYFQAIIEFESYGLKLKFNSFNQENYLLLINYIEQLNSTRLTEKLRSLTHLLTEGAELIYERRNNRLTFSELDMKEYVHNYLQLDSSYERSINIELLKEPFDSKTKSYKKYLKLKKEESFLELINTIYVEQSYGWKSVSNIVEVTYNRYMDEFKKMDVSWLESEISNKKNYLPQIEKLFTINTMDWEHVNTPDYPREIIIRPKKVQIPNLKEIQSETTKTQNEIMILGQLLDSLKSPLLNQDFVNKYLPYYGDGTERSLRGLLSNNKELISKIINK